MDYNNSLQKVYYEDHVIMQIIQIYSEEALHF